MVAEGIEEQSQLTTLEEMGCEMAQGFLLGRPSPPDGIRDLVAGSAARPTDGVPEIPVANGRTPSLVP